MSLTIATQVACPVCGTQYVQKAHQAIDVSSEPQLKETLLQGKFNVSICPQCGNEGVLNLPFLYHDAEKSLFFLFLPMNLPMSDVEQQQLIGRMTNQFIEQLPSEKRRGYMLQPKIYFSLQNLLDDILVADGISREEIEASREKAKRQTSLIQELRRTESPEELREKVEENRDEIDYSFFQLLTLMIEEAQGRKDSDTAEELINLRDEVLEITQEKETSEEPAVISKEELLEAVIGEADPERLRRLVALSRPLLDYAFFQALAERIEAAESGGNEVEAKRLKNIRSTVLEIIDELDQAARQALEQAANFIRQVISQTDAEKERFLRENEDKLDEPFFAVLNLNIREAQQRNDEERAKTLAHIGSLAARILEEKAPPAIRFINQLLGANPDERPGIIEENRQLIDDNLFHTLDQIAAGMSSQASELAQDIQAVRELLEEARRQE